MLTLYQLLLLLPENPIHIEIMTPETNTEFTTLKTFYQETFLFLQDKHICVFLPTFTCHLHKKHCAN